MRIAVRNDVMDQSACVLLISRIVESLLKEDVDAGKKKANVPLNNRTVI